MVMVMELLSITIHHAEDMSQALLAVLSRFMECSLALGIMWSELPVKKVK